MDDYERGRRDAANDIASTFERAAARDSSMLPNAREMYLLLAERIRTWFNRGPEHDLSNKQEDETMKARGVKVEGWVCYCCDGSREAEDIQAVHTEALCLDSEQKILNDSGVRMYVPVPGFIGLCSRHRAEQGVQAADPQPAR